MPNDDLVFAAQMPTREVRKVDRFSLLALGAARKALESSGLDEATKASCGVIVGNMVAGWTFTEPQLRALHGAGLQAVSPYLATAWFPAAPQGQITIQLGIRGFAKTVTTDRCAGAHSIGVAYERIRHGKSEALLAGGVEAPLTPLIERSMPESPGPSQGLREAAAFLLLAPAHRERLVVADHKNFINPGWPSLPGRLRRRAREFLSAAAQEGVDIRWVFLNLPLGYGAEGDVEGALDEAFSSCCAHRCSLTPALGETLAASGALAAVAACQALALEQPGSAAVVLSMGHQTVDLLRVDRVN